MSMFDFVKRTNQLMFGAAKESLTDYTRDISELGNAASQVRDKLSSGTKTARDTMVSFKSKGVVSSVSNWFYGKEFELNDADEMLFDNAEFRSGNPEWDNDTEEADTSALTTSSMKELVKGQVSSMYKIGSKQTEAGIANTAEIVTNISKSSAEIVAAVNNVNSSLIAISGKLDGLVELLKPAQKSQSTATNSWTDSDGRFTIRSLMEGFKNPNNYAGSAGNLGIVASMLSDPNMRQMFLTPENLVSMVIMDPLMRKDFKALGGRSVDSYGRDFQDFTHNMIEDAIHTLIEKTPLGDVMGREKYRGNLGKTENQYTKEAAVFDKATRHSIISVIPEYLKKLTEAVTGQQWNINERGYLTTKTQANPYSRIGDPLNSASLSWDDEKRIATRAANSGINIDSKDMENAQKAWIWVVVHFVIYGGNRNKITGGTIMDMITSPKLDMYLDRAVEVFAASSGGVTKKNSRKILNDVLLMICSDKRSATALANAGNKYMEEIEKAARDTSENNPLADQYSDQSMLDWNTALNNLTRDFAQVKEKEDRRRYAEEVLRKYYEEHGHGKLSKMRAEAAKNQALAEYDKAHPSSNKEEEVTSRIGMDNSKAGFGSFVNELNKYSKSIYDILNKGVINVRLVTGNLESNRTQRGKRVHKLRVKKSSSGGSSDDSSDGEPDVEPTEEVASGSSTSTGWLDNTVDEIRTNGFVNTIRGKISEASNAVGTYYTNTKNTLKMESISNKVNAENSTVSDMDKQRVQMVNTALQTAMQDGDGVEDRAKIRSIISNIQDSALKQEMTKVADSVLTKESSKDEEPKSNSLFGRLLSGLGSKLKSAFSFIMKPIGALLKGIGKGLKAYWNWTKSVWASGVEDGKRGINTIKGGISDYREAAAQSKARRQEAKQQSLRAKQRASIQMDDISDAQWVDAGALPVAEMEDISSVKKTGTDLGGKSESTTLAKIKKKLSTGIGYINDGLKFVRDKIKSAASSLVSGIKSIGEKIANSKFGQFVSNTASTAMEKTKEVASKIADSKVGRAVKGFGSDFAAGFKEARSEKKLAKLDKATPDTIADKESRTIREKLEEFMSKFFNGDNKFAKELRELIQRDTEAVEELAPKMDDIADGNAKGDTDLTGTSKGQYGEMDDLYTGKASPKMESVGGKSKSSDLGGAKSSGGDSAKMADVKDGQKSKGKALGKIAAGAMDIGSMIMKFIGPVLAGMAGIEMITKLVQETLTKVLKPLDKLFKKVFKMLSPVLDTLSESLEPLIDTVSDVLIGVITPLAPVISNILDCLTPILDIVTVLLDAIMIPLKVVMDAVIVPALEVITGCLKGVMGILQLGIGTLMVPLGGILAGIGLISKIVGGGDDLVDKGTDMMSQGTGMIESGAVMAAEGVKEAGIAALKLTGPGLLVGAVTSLVSDSEEEEDETPDSYQAKNVDVAPGSAMEGLIGNGDIVNNYYYQNMYGSGNSTYNQNSYHNGMNMSQHGCGPIALADRANRMGGGINPYSLTQAMMANGNYSANAGTSVAGMISTGRALGMNLVPGGVTSDSLRGASPSNPITVIGSGMGFGTRSGANHYVNVVGTDSSGGAYVSNPMTGRVGRVRANELVANSALGLYGSGDGDVSYGEVFGENVASAFGELKNIWTNISNIFNFSDNETVAEKTQKKLQEQKNKQYIENAKTKYGDDEWQAKYDEFAADNPQENGESDDDYQYRIDKMVYDYFAEEQANNDSFGKMATDIGTFKEGISDTITDFKKSLTASNTFGDSGGFYSASGNVKLATDGYTPEFTDTNMEESVNGHYIHSPIHEFFAKMGGLSWAESNNNWYKYYSDPHSKAGEGNSGDSHQGIDINLGGGVRGVTPVYATTDGILVIHQPEALANGGGNYVEWTDNDGMHHRIMHLDHFSEEMENMRPGDSIIGGKTLLGYYGTTGQSTGDHIHYDISPNGYGSSEWYNPLTYFNFKASATDGDSSYIAGDTLDEQMWQWLRYKGMKLPESSVAGIMGVWKAEGVQPRMIEGAYSEPETSLAEPIYDAIVGDPDNNEAGLQKLWDYTPAHAAGKNGGYLPNYMYNGHPWAGIGLAQWTAGRTYKLLKHAWDHGQRKWYDLLPQLQYFEEELKTTHSKAGNELADGEGRTPEEMAQMFWRDFEGYTWGSQADYDKRRNNARNVYDRFKGTSEINSTNFGTINSNADAYYAGLTDNIPGGSSSSTTTTSSSSGNPSSGGNAKRDAYTNFYTQVLKSKYDKASKSGYSYNNGYPGIILQDYMRAVLRPWSSYLDPDQNGIAGLRITHKDGAPIFYSSQSEADADYRDLTTSMNSTKFKSALKSVMRSDSSLSNLVPYIDYINSTNDVLPSTQGGNANAYQTKTDHEDMIYAYALDKLIGRSSPRYMKNNSYSVLSNYADMKEAFKDLKYTSPVPIGFQSYVGIHGNNYDVKALNDFISGGNNNSTAMQSIPKIFSNDSTSALKALRKAYGSGDEIANSIVDIPPVDYSKLPTDDWTDVIWNSMGNQQQQTQYNQSQNTEVNDQIDRILANEYKTSDKRTHELLEKIYAYLEKKENEDGKPNPNSSNGTTPQGSQDMFEDKIPNSVYRLARG